MARKVKPKAEEKLPVDDRAHIQGAGIVESQLITDTLEINRSRIRARACNDHFGFGFERDFFHFVVIDRLRFFGYPVRHDIIIRTREIDGRAVR